MSILSLAVIVVSLISNTNCVVNYMDLNVITPITNLGTCKAYWSAVATSLYETALLRMNGTTYTVGTLDLSEQFLLSCSFMGDCLSGYTEGAIQYALDNGIPLEATMKYGGSSTQYGIPTPASGDCTTARASAIRLSPKRYLNKYTGLTYARITALLDQNPVASYIYVDTTFKNYDGTTQNGGVNPVYNCSVAVSSDYMLSIPVIIVGYDVSSNLVIFTPGDNSFGGGAYSNTTKQGGGFVVVSPTNSYCGLTRKLSQISATQNSTNNTVIIISGFMLMVSGAALATVLMI